MNELIEKLEHALMVCKVANTRLLNLTAEDGELILQALKAQDAPARLLTPDDWIDNPDVDKNGNLKCWIEFKDREKSGTWTCWCVKDFSYKFYREIRPWNKRPTPEQMEETPWK